MADAVDMSLDDFIKQQRKNNRGNKSKKPNSNTKVSSVRSNIRPKLQRRQTTKSSPVKDNSEQMLHISNLHFKVTDSDLRDLFQEAGPLKKALVHYDKSGRSLGTAEVIYYNRDAAIRAIKEYNQRHLDGRAMDIKLVPSRPTQSAKIGLRSGSGIQKRSPQKVGAGRRPQGKTQFSNKGNLDRKGGKPGNKRNAKPEVTAAQLDAELESYKEEKMNVE